LDTNLLTEGGKPVIRGDVRGVTTGSCSLNLSIEKKTKNGGIKNMVKKSNLKFWFFQNWVHKDLGRGRRLVIQPKCRVRLG